jgi:flotillin
MDFIVGILSIGAPLVVIVALIAILLMNGYVKAPPDKAYVISGVCKKPRMLIGRAGLKIPFFERLDKIDLGAIQIDVKTKSAVPTADFINVNVDSTVSVKIGSTEEDIKLALENFLNVSRDEIGMKVKDLLEGNVREIVGKMKLTEMVSDRKAFAAQVQENAVPDLKKFGLELVSFNVQNFQDDNSVIENLGIDNVEQIRKKAAIAKSDAQREIAIAEADNTKIANDAAAAAKVAMAEKNAEVAVRQSELKRKTDTEQAIADAAYDIQKFEQEKAVKVSQTNAEIAQREREVELKTREIELAERELDAKTRKVADAEAYEVAKKAEAELIKRQREAEAKAYEVEQQAKAQMKKAEADKFSAEQQAAGIAAIGKAEAEAIEKKAEAMAKMEDAAVIQMVLEALPKMTAAAAAPLSNIDNMTVYGSDGGSKIVGDVMQTTNQVTEALKANGIDVADLLTGFFAKRENK